MIHGDEYTHVQIFKDSILSDVVGCARGATLSINGCLPVSLYGEVDIYVGAIEDYVLAPMPDGLFVLSNIPF